MLYYNKIESKGENEMPDQAYKPNWQKWKGKVNGTKMQIENALKELGRDPKTTAELQKVINKQSQDKLAQTLDEADKGKGYTHY